ncbi:hypothetical protein [Actinocrispum sp. NPDC049592]|uniref:hypothetical protein n=1 Tax=Actinocrispum sp. NPDC049592 TaxID=3154835 RepID=UPI00343EB6F7
MASARFQVFTRCSTDGRNNGSAKRHAGSVTWRFLSANNRSIGRSVSDFPDGEACVSALLDLQKVLPGSSVVTVRDELGLWVWRLRVDRSDVAMSTRCYQRRLHAENAGSAFRDLAATVRDIDELQVVHF